MLILSGVAYTVRAHESRAFSVAFVVLGLLLTIDLARHDPRDAAYALGLPLVTMVIGAVMTASTFALARLRRVRAQVHVEPGG